MPVRCVIVDDNEGFVAAARRVLDRDGVTVVGVAANTGDALTLVAEVRPDVVLVDVCLGEEDGFALAERITAASADSGPPPLILISTHAVEEFEEIVEHSPALAFLTKIDLSGYAVRGILTRGHRRGSRRRHMG